MYVLINNAPDGRHVRVFKEKHNALSALADFLGRKAEELCVNVAYYSDWGNRLVVEARSDHHTVNIEKRLAEAFDARECGTATIKQLKLLEEHNF